MTARPRDSVVLARSGGLDPSVPLGWIAADTGAEVAAAAVDVGQGGVDLEVVRQRALDDVVRSSQQHVTGDVRRTLHVGTATVSGQRSDGSPYDVDLATCDAGDTCDQTPSTGSGELRHVPSRIAARRDQLTAP